ncbi:hypothetical protein NQ317_014050 [Molorchus minor]|uniref:A kinase anchor protein 9 n=1 Tax=Molorchus minor TaxID=1323400 RepID=A0ABQ9JY15_9CUCU|nr:hypothetical protein NQ317_014050 [Molorchus minor]
MTIDDNETLFTKMDVDVKENNKEYEGLKRQFEVVLQEKSKLQSELNEVNQTYLRETAEKQDMLQQQLKELTASRNELINIVTTKHNESVAYHNEIQRLSQILTSETDKCKNLEMQLSQLKTSYVSSEEIELKNQELETVLQQNSFLKEKCEIMGKNLLEEQTKLQQLLAEKSIPSEKEISLQKKLERLQTHLIELEEHYTQELLQAEQKNTELQTKLNEIKEREQNS